MCFVVEARETGGERKRTWCGVLGEFFKDLFASLASSGRPNWIQCQEEIDISFRLRSMHFGPKKYGELYACMMGNDKRKSRN